MVLDEAGMISSRQMSELLGVVERRCARVVLTGDTRQIQSVEVGDALRILEKESRLKSASLREVLRQTDRDHRSAIEELRQNPESGFRRLEEIGAVREAPWTERASAVAAAWKQGRTAKGGRTRSVLVVCATHDEIANVTNSIREFRKSAGELGEERQVVRDVALGWTTAQKGDWRNFRSGHVLGLHRAVKGIERNFGCRGRAVGREGRGGAERERNRMYIDGQAGAVL